MSLIGIIASSKLGVVAPSSVNYLVVAGGAGGGYDNGRSGGGGAGGMLTSTLSISSGISYTVTVGAGGNGATNGTVKGSNGNDSVFSSITEVLVVVPYHLQLLAAQEYQAKVMMAPLVVRATLAAVVVAVLVDLENLVQLLTQEKAA
jgi:hypothetical protein